MYEIFWLFILGGNGWTRKNKGRIVAKNCSNRQSWKTFFALAEIEKKKVKKRKPLKKYVSGKDCEKTPDKAWENYGLWKKKTLENGWEKSCKAKVCLDQTPILGFILTANLECGLLKTAKKQLFLKLLNLRYIDSVNKIMF